MAEKERAGIETRLKVVYDIGVTRPLYFNWLKISINNLGCFLHLSYSHAIRIVTLYHSHILRIYRNDNPGVSGIAFFGKLVENNISRYWFIVKLIALSVCPYMHSMPSQYTYGLDHSFT